MSDHDELRRLAQAATPGPWHVEFAGELDDKSAIIECARWRGLLNTINLGEDHATAAFIAAANPATVIALLDMLTSARERADVQGEAADRLRTDLAAANARIAQVDAKGGIADLFGERDQWRKTAEKLEAENATLRERITELEQVTATVPTKQARIKDLEAHILDIDAHATPFGDIPDDPGYVGQYLVTAGALHRALGKIGHTAPSCDAEARIDKALALVNEARQTWGDNMDGYYGFMLNGIPFRDAMTEALAADTPTTATAEGSEG